eukprot:Phypoly_transcript_15838.p1 GENE.Phypoly_transcript_15838~~Phypoly_transcript_15838.p1  ORF type:complete len:198 (+),score=24.44 Phypoly_transcript_15838:30-596(+)
MAHEGPITATQIEFLAEDENVTIFPNFKMPELYFIQGAVGPFQPGVPISVPLWLALTLKKRKKCKIQPPTWLDADYLETKFDSETHDDKSFELLPFHYIEIATLLLNHAQDDIPFAPQIRATIEDIWNRRASKVRDGLRTIGAETSGIQLSNITAMEINKIRPFISKAMDQFYMLSQKAEEPTPNANQ